MFQNVAILIPNKKIKKFNLYLKGNIIFWLFIFKEKWSLGHLSLQKIAILTPVLRHVVFSQ